MKTLLDTCTLVYALERTDALGTWARGIIAACVAGEGAVTDTIALAEVGVGAEDPDTLAADVASWGVQLVPLPTNSAPVAARAFRAYLEALREQGKRRGDMPLPDFLIGAHAEAAGYRIATNDTARFRAYFPQVELVTPPDEATE